jgi:hypothetical protein
MAHVALGTGLPPSTLYQVIYEGGMLQLRHYQQFGAVGLNGG